MTETLRRFDDATLPGAVYVPEDVEAQVREKITHHFGSATDDEIRSALNLGWSYGLMSERLHEQDIRAIAYGICQEEAAKQPLSADELRYEELDFNRLGLDFVPVLDAVSISAIAAIRHVRNSKTK